MRKPVELFGPPKTGSWTKPKLALLEDHHRTKSKVMVAHHDGWVPMQITELTKSKDGRRLKRLTVETPHGGIMELTPGQVNVSVLVRDPKRRQY